MKKIGFIDYYIDNFHANKYVGWFRESEFKDKMDVAYAYEEKCIGGKNIDQWCAENKVAKLNSPEEIVAKADYIIVLSPNNPERHYELSEYALKSGKPTYIDKTFAPDTKTAKKLIALAEANNTPMFSTSGLRYSKELAGFMKNTENTQVSFISIRGPSTWEAYAVHQVEMVVMALGRGAKRVMQISKGKVAAIIVDYEDNRSAIINAANSVKGNQGFEVNAQYGDTAISFSITDYDYFFKALIKAIAIFFETREVPVAHEDTYEVMKIIEGGKRALKKPFTWIKLEN